jgi:DNA polymerase III subunit gamma/tau
MANQVFARKWRPRTFGTLVGQDHVVRALTHALDTQRLHHAYLFTGTRGVGKTTIARILAKSLNCEKGVSANPCGVCSACTEVDQGRFTDYIEMDAASNRGVEQMAQLLDQAVYAPTIGRYKVYMIDEVHMLTTHAFNAMLKTLEEPPPHIVFILATTDPQKVPVTVLSRCLQFNLKNMPVPSIIGHLQAILTDEKIEFETPALSMIARAASGSMRDALSLLDQAIAFGGGKAMTDSVGQMLGAINHADLFGLLRALLAGDGAQLLSMAEQLHANGVPLEKLLQDFAALVHRLALAKVAAPSEEGEFDAPQLLEFAALATPEELQVYYQIVIYGLRDLPLAPDPLSGFSMTLLRLLAFRPTLGVSKPVASGAAVPVPLAATAATSTPAATRPVAVSQVAIAKPAQAAAQLQMPSAVKTVGSKIDFDGDWPRLAAAVPLSGMARQLATTSELVTFNGDQFEIRVALKALADATNVNRLRDALSEHFGRPVRVAVTIGAVQGITAAVVKKEHDDQRLASAQENIDADPFVQSVMSEFGASVVPGSIQSTKDVQATNESQHSVKGSES